MTTALPTEFMDMTDSKTLDVEMSSSLSLSMEKALQNSLVLHKIIGDLAVHELKMCRLVCSTWRLISSKIMRRKCSRVRLKYDNNRNTFTRSSLQFSPQLEPQRTHHVECDDLKFLNKLLKTSTNFPCVDFTFEGGILESNESKDFFTIYGQSLRSLTLITALREHPTNSHEDTLLLNSELCTSKSTFINILQNQAPNIEKLILINFGWSWTTDEQQEEHLFLPSLKLFSWTCQVPTFLQEAILRGANNLTCTLPSDISGALMVANTGRSNTLQEFLLPSDSKSSTFESLTQFANLSWPNLVKIAVPHLIFKTVTDKMTVSMALQQLFLSCSLTLECLLIMEFGFFPEINVLPVFTRLKSLSLSHFNNSPQRCFPARIDLKKTFPQLKSLDIGLLSCDDDEDWEKHFPSTDPFCGDFSQVQTLKVSDHISQFWMQRLHKLCPNFTTLVVYSHEQTEQVLSKICRFWNHLQELEIVIWNCENLNVDSVFTGINKDICVQLKEQRYVGTMDEMKADSSIGNLKHLKKLQLWFVANFVKGELPISWVSGVYAFQRLSTDLKIIIKFDHYKYSTKELQSIYDAASFSSLKVNVNIYHEKL